MIEEFVVVMTTGVDRWGYVRGMGSTYPDLRIKADTNGILRWGYGNGIRFLFVPFDKPDLLRGIAPPDRAIVVGKCRELMTEAMREALEDVLLFKQGTITYEPEAPSPARVFEF